MSSTDRDSMLDTGSRHRRTGSDPADIFNPDANSDDRDTNEGSLGNRSDDEERFNAGIDVDSEEEERMTRHTVRIDMPRRIAMGSLLPAALLIDKSILSPWQVLDRGTGTTVLHYAAHYGNLKFIRWVSQSEDKIDFGIKDNYGLNLTHYAARMGHLPVLMFLTEKVGVDAGAKDNFGNTPLDLTVDQRHLYCFIYLYYARNQRQLNEAGLADRA